MSGVTEREAEPVWLTGLSPSPENLMLELESNRV
jgi:hypothetical protein